MREDKPSRFLKAQQAFFVLQDQIISRDILIVKAFLICRTIYSAASLFVDTEVASMDPTDIVSSGAQILLICRVKHGQILVENVQIFLFKHLAIL